jgi:hypothetical protein
MILPQLGRVAGGSLILALACAGPAARAASVLDPGAFASSGSLNLVSGAYTIDTSGGAGGVPVLTDSGGTVVATGSSYNQGGTVDPTVGVLDFSSVSIGAGVTITVTGANPLALLSRGNQVIDGSITANGSPGNDAAAGAGGAGGFAGGAGAAPGGLGAMGLGPGGGPQTNGGVFGYGAGGSYGGVGSNLSPPEVSYVAGTTYGNLNLALEGGSGGSGSGSAFGSPGTGGGGGGGAIELGALGALSLNDESFEEYGLVEANGGGGAGFVPIAGGGSGGGVILDAPSVALTGNHPSIYASGASYGGGGGRILVLTDAGGLTLDGDVYQGTGVVSSLGVFTDTTAVDSGDPGVIEVGLLGPSAVPEPGAWALMLVGFGLAGAALRGRRRSGVAPGPAPGAIDHGTAPSLSSIS